MKAVKNLKFALAAVAFLPLTSAQAALIQFNSTGAIQQWVTPNNVSEVTIRAWGAQGQSNAGGVLGGLGGFISGTMNVSAGDVFNIFVGEGGMVSTVGGFNGGGNAGTVGAANAFGGGGGGATDVRIGGIGLFDRVAVAAGGGGAGGNRVGGQGRGTGGGGGAGYYGGGGGAAWPYQSITVPTGGSQTQGGNGGTSNWSVSNNNGTQGALGTGGNGGNEISSSQGGSAAANQGGAGGGLVGSSGSYGANWTGQSGAGGSSYLGALTNTQMLAGIRSGNGFFEIEFETVAVPAPATSLLFGLGLSSLFLLRRRKTSQ